MRRCFVIMFIEHKFHGVSTGFESVKKLMRDLHEFFKGCFNVPHMTSPCYVNEV